MIEQLKCYIKENNLHNKAIESFWVAFKNWKNDNPIDYAHVFNNVQIEELNVFIHSVGLRSSEWPECDYNHVTVSILIHYEGRQLGNYIAWYSLNSDVNNDDFLEIY